ncbi:SMI1/KNR4 family protein [Phenylobacterium aquaticum]|uniref:SMI1/KNR4 family protein n=3 Tax=Phenylobacterium aquaticum TaxID=1763816 RepID=UPI0026EC3DED|nr:SMI1/KNR4 family protein [Phenylobacterium aquaticum]
MTIDNLLKVIPPPAEPFEAFLGTWELIEADLGTALPQDYKDYVRIYGNGAVLQYIGIYIPGARDPRVRLEANIPLVCNGFRGLDHVPYPWWPAAGGLIPFGLTGAGDYLFWLSRGDPDDWPVVVWGHGYGDFELIERDFTDFLAGLATGEVAPKSFPIDFLPCETPFEPNWARPIEDSETIWTIFTPEHARPRKFGPLRTRLTFPIRPPV